MCAILNVENLMNFDSLIYALLFRFCLQPHLQLRYFPFFNYLGGGVGVKP